MSSVGETLQVNDGLIIAPALRKLALGILLALLVSGIVGLSTTSVAGYIPVVLAGMVLALLSFAYPVAAISIIILFHAIILEPTESITVPEVVFAVYFYSYLGLWFANKLFVQHKRVVLAWVDIFLLAYVIMSFCSGIVAVLGNASVLKWFREFLTVAVFLLYFPARDAIKTEKDLKIIGCAFLLLALFFAVKNIWNYRSGAVAATYVWELQTGRKALHAHLFYVGTVVITSLFAHTRTMRHRLLLAVLFGVLVSALMVSFTRGFWIATLAGLIALGSVLHPTRRKPIIQLLGGGAVAAFIATMLFFPHLGKFLFESMASRFLSTGTVNTDMSILERVVESKAAINAFFLNPIIGHGYGATFSFYNIIEHETEAQWYVHNSYLFLLFKVGIVGAFLFLGYYFGVVWRAFVNAKSAQKDALGAPLRAAIQSGVFGVLASVLTVAITSNMFIDKESLLIISLSTAIIMANPPQYNKSLAE